MFFSQEKLKQELDFLVRFPIYVNLEQPVQLWERLIDIYSPFSNILKTK